MGKIIAVCISKKKGVVKTDIKSSRVIENHGLENDAHSGNWHRQISLLSFEKVEQSRSRGAKVKSGDFGENLLVEGIDFRNLPVGTRLLCNGVELEITQIGKECHSNCEIYKQIGDCIMPREGVFAKVLKGGIISIDDEMQAIILD